MNEVINRSLVEWDGQNFASAFANNDVEFTINDIELPIAPLHISVQKEDLNYSYKTLRTKKSVKIGSGTGVYNLQLSLLFPKETLLMLHRLIVQVRNNPFVFIKNSYIKSLIDPKLYERKNLFFTVTNLHIKTYDQYPDTYVANMDLRFFNHIPYSNFLKYKKEFLAKVGNTSYSIGVWDSNKPIVEVSEDNRERGFSSRRTNEREDLLTAAIRFGEEESRYEETFGVTNPKESNIYVRYYNQLQLNSLEESFGILKSDIKTKLGNKADWFEKGHEGFVLGIHSKFLDQETKKFILDSMTGEVNSSVRIYYDEYLQVRLSIEALNQLKELKDNFNSNSNNRNTSRTFNQEIASNLDAYSRANRVSLRVEPGLADISEVNVGTITIADESFLNTYISPIQTNPSISKTTSRAFEETKKLLISFDKVQWIFAPFGDGKARLEKQGNDLVLGDSERYFTFKNATQIPGMQFPLEGINQGNIIGYASESPLEIEIQDSYFSINELLENRDTAAPNLEFLNPENEKLYSELSLFTDKILNQNYNLYIQENVSNVFYRALSFEIPIGETTDVNEKDSFLINFSGGFQNLVSSIPISGLEYPTHQFLGSIEPNYMFNFVSKENKDGEHGFSFNLEKVRSTLAQNSRMFKQIYDSGNFIVESFITKLLGSFKVGSYRTIQEFTEEASNAPVFREYNDLDKKNFIISSVSDESIEGLPGSTSTLLRVSETGSINDEELELVTPTRNEEENSRETNNAAYQNALDLYDRLQERQNLELPNREFIQGDSSYEPRNWRTQRFSADRWYAKARRRGGRAFSREIISDLQDYAAWLFCHGILDKLKIYYSDRNVYLFSTYGERGATVSHHEVNVAADLRVEGVHVAEVAAVVELLLEEGIAYNPVYQEYSDNPNRPGIPNSRNRHYIGMGVYGNAGSTEDRLVLENVMNGTKVGGFVHLDLNINTTPLDNDANRDLTSIRRENVRARRWLGESSGDRFFLRNFWSNGFWQYKRAHKAEILRKIREIFGTSTNNFNVIEEPPEEDDLNINETHDRVGLPELLLVRPNEGEASLEDILDQYKRENNTNAPYTDFTVEQIEYDALSEEDKRRITNEEDSSFFIIRAVQDRPRRVLRPYDTSPVLSRSEVRERLTQNNYIVIGSSRVAEYNLRTREIEYRQIEEGTERVLVQRRGRNVQNNNGRSEYQNIVFQEEENLKIIIKMIGNFSKFANFILTEPSVYIQDEAEQEAELRRISDELLGTIINPGLYRYIYKLSSVIKFASERRRTFRGYIDEREHCKLFDPFFGEVLNINYPSPELESFEYFTDPSFDYEDWIDDYFVQGSNPIEGGVSELIQKFFSEHPDLQNMNGFANSLQAFNDIKQIINVNYLDNANSSLNILSGQMQFQEEINKVLIFILGRGNKEDSFNFRTTENTINISGRYHVRSNEFLFNLFVYENRSTAPSVSRTLQNYRDTSEYRGLIESIKLSQDTKLAYLKNLLLSLIAKLKTNRVFREALNLNTETDLYRIDVSNRNAYPDLDLPADPADPTKNIAIHPGFFFYTQKDKRNIASISELENKIGYQRTLNNSIEFQKFLQNGVFSGSQEALERRRRGIQISGNNVVLDDILLDSSEGSEETKVVSSQSNDGINSIQLSDEGLPSTENGEFGENNFNNINLSIFKNTTFSSDLYNISESDLRNYLTRINNVSSVLSSYTGRIFGSKYGYLKEEIESNVNISNEIATQMSERLGANNPEYVNDNFVKQIIEDSGKAYLSKTESIQKAYPTFKLYLIEEDTQDSDNYYVFDDFYSYSAVKDFTVYKSRKLAADTAVIRLQNISGSLDGTKRVGKRDIDIEREEERVGFIDSGQTISSIVLRPGVNAQLRMGYESDPNKLEIMLSGQITDISWSSQGDMCEVTLQSFGVELESFKFGSENVLEERSDFESTHTLLGYLLLRDELKHFGRHKEGRNVQIFENTETLADKTIYTPDAWKYNWTMNYVSTLNNNSLWLTVALGVGTFLIPGGWILKGGRLLLNAFKITRGRALLGAAARGAGAGLQGTGRGGVGRFFIGKTATQFSQTSAYKGVTALTAAVRSEGFAGGLNAIKNAGVLNTLRASASLAIRPLQYGVGPIVQIAAVTTGGLLIAETAVNGASSVYESISRYLKDIFTPKKKYLKLSPQDDNIFAPHPNRYINRSENSIEWEKVITKGFLTYLNLRTAGIAGRPGNNDNLQEELIKNPLQYFDKRFKNGNHKYSLGALIGGKTVWEIFDEMSIRHPGWVYGARQYGDGLEYRMFFGLPSQKYWARDLSSFVINRLNKIYLYVSESSGQFSYEDLMSDEQIKLLQKIIGRGRDIEEASKKILFAEWVKRTESRMKPFRSFHHISSSKNLISNQIRGKNENTINTVSVVFNDSDGRKIRTVKAHENIPEEKIRGRQVSYENCKGMEGALRYGIGLLMQSAKEMYTGEILIIGDPSINPHDICILDDHYLDMYGPLEVEAVTHIFGHETGFITEIKPNAVVTANESVTYTALNTMVWYDVIREMNEEKDSNTIKELKEEQRLNLITDALDNVFSDNETLDNLDSATQEELKRYFKGEIEKAFRDGNITLIENVFNQTGGTPELISRLETGVDRLLGIGGTGTTAVAGGLALRGNPRAATISLVLGAIQLGLASLPKSNYFLNQIKNPSSYIHKKLFGGDMHAARVSGTQLLQIYPLYKRGLPILASGFENINPKHVWRNRLGEIFNDVSDAYSGFLNQTEDYKRLGASDLYDGTFDNMLLKVKPFVLSHTGALFGLDRNAIRGYLIDEANNE